MVDASVVIPCHNAALTLGEQLGALLDQSYQGCYEIVVADNGSGDGSCELARGWEARDPRVRVLVADRVRGANFARNQGVHASEGDLILFCDADDVADRDWISAMVRAERSGCTAMGGRLEEHELNTHHSTRWRSPATPGTLPVGLDFLPFPVGANCAVRRPVFEEVGGFDEAWVRGGTEVEFFWRVQLAGHDVCFVDDAVMHYRHRAGLLPTVRQYRTWGRSDVRLYRRFRNAGVGRPSARTIARDWRDLLRGVIRARDSDALRQRLCDLAYRVGRIEGSFQYRCYYP